jgi:hypothetical protein
MKKEDDQIYQHIQAFQSKDDPYPEAKGKGSDSTVNAAHSRDTTNSTAH